MDILRRNASPVVREMRQVVILTSINLTLTFVVFLVVMSR